MRRACRVWLALAAIALLAAAYGPLAQAAQPAGDIAFIVDGSSSMRNELDSIRDRVDQIVAALEERLEARYALVAFGGNSPTAPNGEPRTITALADAATFGRAFDAFQSSPASGGASQEPGLEAVRYAMNEVSGYRAGAGACAIVFSDEAPSFVEGQDADLASALGALNSRRAVFFGVIKPGNPVTRATYGPETGSLAESTGGAIFEIDELATDPTAVLDALLDACGREASRRASAAAFEALPTTGVAPLGVSFDATTDPHTTSYVWDFGDGTTGSGAKISHVFKQAGTFRVTLTAIGATEEVKAELEIKVRARGPRIVRPSDCTIRGTAGPDLLVGTAGDDMICGFGGDDVLRGGGGNDALAGGLGRDRLVAGLGHDWLAGQLGHDVLLGGRGNDILLGAKGADKLNGGAGNDRLKGGTGADRLVGHNGRDVIYGGPGHDTLIGSRGRDQLRGGNGNDMFLAADGKVDLVDGGRGIDRAELDKVDQPRRVSFTFS
ncbi:MAG: PKD domain-containing protein [Gaiellaceae bacterium]